MESLFICVLVMILNNIACWGFSLGIWRIVILSSADSCRNIHIYTRYIPTQWTTDAMIRTQEDFFNKIFTSHFIARVRKGCVWFYCERELETEHNWNILTPLLWPSRCLSCSPGLLNRRPRAHTAGWSAISYQQLLRSPNSIGVPEGPLGQVWLSLPHLLSNCLELYCQLHWPPGRRTQQEPELNSTGSSNSSELYYRSTPTRCLKSNV